MPTTSQQEECLKKLRKDSTEEVDICTEAVNVKRIVERLSCPPQPSGGVSSAAATPQLSLPTRPKTTNTTPGRNISATFFGKKNHGSSGEGRVMTSIWAG